MPPMQALGRQGWSGFCKKARLRKLAYRTSLQPGEGLGRQAGFSLLEIIMVIGLAAFLYAVALPNFNLITGNEVATRLGQLAEDVKAAYDYAVLKGQPVRLVFHLYSGKYWLEATDSRQVKLPQEKLSMDLLAKDEEQKRADFNGAFARYEELAGEAVKRVDKDKEEEIAVETPVIKAKEALQGPSWYRLDTLEWGQRSLGDHLIIRDMQAEHHEKPVNVEEEGQQAYAYLYFFPFGYVEKAFMHIFYKKGEGESDPETPPYTVIVHPFEGYAEVRPGFEEIDLNSESQIF